MSQAHADCPHCRQDGSEAKHIALKEVRIALAGNPNCGKTTAFNEYTGTHQHVGNYPGVTVDKKEGYVSIDGVEVLMVDLPGTYSLTAYSQEEIVTRAVLAPEKAEEKPMAVVDLVDTSALERNLFLTVQIMEMGLPVVLACNMMDEARKAGIQVDTKELGKQLGIPVVATVARSGEGLKDALREAIAFGRRGSAPLNISYGPDLDPVLTKMERLLAEKGLLTDRYPTRWIALKVLENDSEILRQVERMPDVAAQLRADRETVADHLRDTLQTSPEAIIADYRYGFIRGVLRSGAVRRESAKDRLELSDKLDKVLTNTLFGPLIMLGVLYAMFQLTFVIGAYPQGWVEDGFGWLGETVSALMPDGFLKSLIVSGVIDGLGGVMSFVPLIIIMFTLVAILEDFGYMARMAYMLDRVFRAFGLHGASVMPFIIAGGIAGGCAIPGVMATRTLRSPKEKLATLLTLPYMACGAKLPVFLLLVGVFFPENPARTMFLLTLAGWAAALLMARLMRSTIIRGESTPFVMELPPYRVPTLRSVVTHCWERTWMYLKKAGTVPGKGLSWFRDTGYAQLIEEIDKTEGSKPIAVIFNLGVNDLGNAGNYVSYMTNIASTLKSKNCKLFYMSVNPINSIMITKAGRGARTEAQVREFNSKISSGLSLYYKYIDMYSVLMKKGYGTNARYDGVDDGDDGLHYTTKTFKRIYYYCITYLNTGSINASYY